MRANGISSPDNGASLPLASPPDATRVAAHLEKILASPGFRNAERRGGLLRWAVERALSGDRQPVKEYQIGVEAFGKDEDYDPRIDSIVRVEFSRLRQKLREYYASEGQSDSIVIDFPARGYVPSFTEQIPGTGVISETPPTLTAPVLPTAAPVVPVAVPLVRRRRWVPWLFAVGGLTAGIVGASIYRMARAPEASLSSIAVLPFLNLSPEGGTEYLSDGVTDELTTNLAAIQNLRVVARTSAYQFKGKNADVRQIGRDLGVGSVLEGSIRKEGNRLRIITQLIRASDGTHIWAQTYDAESKDLLAIQDEMARAITTALRLRISAPRTPAVAFQPGEKAHDLFLKGSYEIDKMTPASLEKAIHLFQEVIRDEPQYARAYAGLGTAYLNRAGFAPGIARNDLDKAKEAYDQAIRLDPNSGLAHGDRAYLTWIDDWDWPRAEQEFQLSLRLAQIASSHSFYAVGLMTHGRFAEAEAHFRTSLELDPLSLWMHNNFAVALLEERKFAQAEEQIRFCLERQPKFFALPFLMGISALYQHRPEAAEAEFRKSEELAPHNHLAIVGLAMAHAQMGRRAEALAEVKSVENPGPNGMAERCHIAVVYAALGDRDQTFAWLNKSADAREEQIFYLKTTPLLDGFREDPRFQALTKRIGLDR